MRHVIETTLEEIDRALSTERPAYSDERRDEIARLAAVLATDPAAYILDVQKAAHRLWLRGVRVVAP